MSLTAVTDTTPARPRPGLRAQLGMLMRRRIAPTAGLAFLLAGGALCVRITAVTMLGGGEGPVWLYTAAACVLAGVALILLALPKLVPSREGTAHPDPPHEAG